MRAGMAHCPNFKPKHAVHIAGLVPARKRVAA
jgi:hypothetical protein